MIGTILALAGPIISNLIPVLEKAFGGKEKKPGENPKMDTLMSMLSMFVASLNQFKVVDDVKMEQISPQLRGAAEQILADMKANGTVLTGVSPSNPGVAAGTNYVGVNFQDMIILRQVK